MIKFLNPPCSPVELSVTSRLLRQRWTAGYWSRRHRQLHSTTRWIQRGILNFTYSFLICRDRHHTAARYMGRHSYQLHQFTYLSLEDLPRHSVHRHSYQLHQFTYLSLEDLPRHSVHRHSYQLHQFTYLSLEDLPRHSVHRHSYQLHQFTYLSLEDLPRHSVHRHS